MSFTASPHAQKAQAMIDRCVQFAADIEVAIEVMRRTL